MTLNLFLDSNLARRQYRVGEKQKTHDFTINFHPPIRLEKTKNYKAALNKLITMSYSWYNIAEAYGNNKLRWRKNSEDWQTLTFPDGMYDYEGVERFLRSQTGFVDPNAANKEHIFSLYFDFNIYRVVINMAENYELDLTGGEFASLIGYEKKVLKDAKNFTGTLLPDITRSVDWVFLHCDLITRAANDVESDVLYSLPIVGRQVSYPFNEEPYRLEWHPVNKSQIDSIRVWVTDGRNLLDLNGIDVALSVMVEEE